MRVTRPAILTLLCCCSVAVAWYWDVQKVDSAGWGASVEMRWQPNGQLVMCYSDTLGNIRMAWPIPAPKYRDLPHWRSVIPGTQAFDIDGRGTIGLSYIGTDGRNYYAVKTDTTWVDFQTPFYPWNRSPTALDTAGNPVITIQLEDTFLLARKLDTQWVTTALRTGDAAMNPAFGCSDLGSKKDGTVWGVFWYEFSWPKQKIYGMSLYSFQVQDSQTSVATIKSGAVNSVDCASGCVDHQGAVHASYSYWQQAGASGFYLDSSRIDSTRQVRTAVKYDTLDRPQIAYVTWDNTLMYRYLDSGAWHVFDLQTTDLNALSLAIDENSEPLIAYTTRDGVFLARGVGVTGQSEEIPGPLVSGSPSTVTIVRGVLVLGSVGSRQQTVDRAELLDAAGRKVAELHAGANDVSRLSPGVYFVRQASCVERAASSVTKVVLTD